MKWSRRRLLVNLYWEQGKLCYYCKVKAFLQPVGFKGPQHRRAATLEHLLPVSKGGGTSTLNCVMACHRCNSERGNTLLGEWLGQIEQRQTPRCEAVS